MKALTTLCHPHGCCYEIFYVWCRLLQKMTEEFLNNQAAIFSLSLRYCGTCKSHKNSDGMTLTVVPAQPISIFLPSLAIIRREPKEYFWNTLSAL